MTYATLLAYVDDGADADARLSAVCDLAAAFDAHVIGVAASELDAPLVDGFGAGAMMGEMLTLRRDQALAELAAAETRFKAVAERNGLRFEWRGEIGYPGAFTARQSRAADIVVVGQAAPEADPFRSPDVGDLLMSTGRPVMVAPPGPAKAPLDGVVVVAWKDTREAQRAAASALPLLKAASKVIVLEICDDDEVDSARLRTDDVAAWLDRHGVRAQADVKTAESGGAGKQLLTYAENVGAELIVSGAWGHARMRQWIFGGVTQALLSDSRAWLLLCH